MHTTVLRATHPGFSDIATALHLHQKRLRLQPDFEKVGTGLSDRRITFPLKQPLDDQFLRVLCVRQIVKKSDC